MSRSYLSLRYFADLLVMTISKLNHLTRLFQTASNLLYMCHLLVSFMHFFANYINRCV